MTILVTGGAGFIGSNFIYYLLKEHPEDRVLCVDCLTYAGNLSTLKEALEKRGIKLDKESFEKLVDEIKGLGRKKEVVPAEDFDAE